MAEKIGEFLIRIGAMRPDQVERVIQLQSAGDKRRFGVIAAELKYITCYEKIRDFMKVLKE